jgi:hypothetical protein
MPPVGGMPVEVANSAASASGASGTGAPVAGSVGRM